jgi:hypothetical protein
MIAELVVMLGLLDVIEMYVEMHCAFFAMTI